MEISVQHELFIEAYLETASVNDAAKAAGFDRSYGPKLFHKLKDRIVPMMEDRMAMMQMKAINVMEDSMGDGALKPKQDIRIRAAQDIMDRGGLTKKQSIDVSGSVLPAVMILPAKNPTAPTREPTED
ncbi:hypothetical protein CHOED_086 [Vibrio phage CHOED]|uniref:hypothetical protein n=1 Tax=Vibrio phage CHOED TaxID=1458716 RepID=UPI00042E3242|nr:hypothetical protein CHOED_086 [Vibrio phage CHOED]AHK11946.1 hypothetical protein CHOED_086 [Vibrio phage CHOED]